MTNKKSKSKRTNPTLTDRQLTYFMQTAFDAGFYAGTGDERVEIIGELRKNLIKLGHDPEPFWLHVGNVLLKHKR